MIALLLDAEPFSFSERQRAEIARIFGQSAEDAEMPGGTIERIEWAVRQYLSPLSDYDSLVVDNLPNSDPASMRKHRKRAEKLIAASAALRRLLDEASAADANVIDDLDFRSNIVGALALAGPSKRKRLAFGEDESAEVLAFLQTGEIALEAIRHSLAHLEAAAELWLSYTKKPRGGSKARHNDLILSLHQACYPWSPSQSDPPESPTATTSRLTRVFGMVMEALGEKLPANIEQAIIRALEYEASEEGASTQWFDEVQGFGDRQ